MSTFMAKKGEVQQRWFVIDATDQVVGRLAVQIATILRGKHRPEYTPHVDTGEFVIVVNAAKVRFTGRKWETQTYQSYSHYPGGLKVQTAQEVRLKHPERILIDAVRRMVPRNRLGRQQMSKLKVYAGPSHPHQAQNPVEFKV
jgi:large subunit ribosomal protein L13